MPNLDLVNRMTESIKLSIKDSIDKEYTEYKNKCLQELNVKLEAKRNDVVRRVLDGIDILVSSNEPESSEPIINIRVVKNIYIKGE